VTFDLISACLKFEARANGKYSKKWLAQAWDGLTRAMDGGRNFVVKSI
jgi:hypothetical protein